MKFELPKEKSWNNLNESLALHKNKVQINSYFFTKSVVKIIIQYLIIKA